MTSSFSYLYKNLFSYAFSSKNFFVHLLSNHQFNQLQVIFLEEKPKPSQFQIKIINSY